MEFGINLVSLLVPSLSEFEELSTVEKNVTESPLFSNPHNSCCNFS